MAINAKVYKELHLVPVRFERAATGAADSTMPDLDDRGHTAKVPAVNGLAASPALRGPVVGMQKDQRIRLRLVRAAIDPAAPLYLVSSDETVVTVETPAKGAPVAAGPSTVIALKGQSYTGTTPKSAEVQVRFQSDQGPILGVLTVYVFSPLPVAVTPHLVTINNPAGSAGVAPAIDLEALMTQTKAIWACCGISLAVQAPRAWSVNLPSANLLRFPDDFSRIAAVNFNPGTINLYIVREVLGACGVGLSRSVVANLPGYTGLQPGIYLGEVCGGGRTSPWGANDLAHELGHFFSLWHPSDGPTTGTLPAAGWPWARYETWSRRLLMHNWNQTARPPYGAPPWADYDDVGYGANLRGALIPLKEVRTGRDQAGRDAHGVLARNYVKSGTIY
ncbi:hypothetical protein [Candidatus Thiodictyon syntrophicum]|jgi:hypothetical protein|uniref:Peptidase M43 pregnancy-associated plasma-A domain-containing protein n=1 Tax=Candidatus Thiodictyon syntrophicum TaxID=1166950 RepID=A0A2K8UJ53_9GAMM|nr:hypothetical protein [Candidatus Thiodictyon syntrophicum]AUB85613.1 hypothetical protein THSYN_32440 [Candidatus Thiodictyon syntrophicum]